MSGAGQAIARAIMCGGLIMCAAVGLTWAIDAVAGWWRR